MKQLLTDYKISSIVSAITSFKLTQGLFSNLHKYIIKISDKFNKEPFHSFLPKDTFLYPLKSKEEKFLVKDFLLPRTFDHDFVENSSGTHFIYTSIFITITRQNENARQRTFLSIKCFHLYNVVYKTGI